MPLTVGVEHWPLAAPFAIARGAKTAAITVTARIAETTGGRAVVGHGEATPYARYGEAPESTADAIETQRGLVDDPALTPAERRARLLDALPAGAARNALDCALWDLEAKQKGVSAASLAGLTPPDQTTTAFTLGLDAPEAMGAAAAAAVASGKGAMLKAKFGRGAPEEEIARLEAIRAAAPEAKLIVDANEGWSLETLTALDPACAAAGALFIEQPLPSDQDESLRGLGLATPLCADESCHGAADLPRLKGLFQVVNLKLDKTGGLTAALALREAATANGFDVMVGCMVAGSLAMAPAYLLTEGALAVDLDGPLLLAEDREHGLRFEGSRVQGPSPALWG